MPQYAGHHPRAPPPEGRSCRRPWRCRVPTAARPLESVARLRRSWRQCSVHSAPLMHATGPPPLSGGLWELRTAGSAGTRAWWSRACLRTPHSAPALPVPLCRTPPCALLACCLTPCGASCIVLCPAPAHGVWRALWLARRYLHYTTSMLSATPRWGWNHRVCILYYSAVSSIRY
jgi:hypothetical protein